MKSFQQYQMSDRLLIKARIKSDLTYLFYISTSSVGARESMKPVADPRAAQFQPTPVCLFFPLHRTTLPHPLLSLTYRYTHTLSSHRFNPPRSPLSCFIRADSALYNLILQSRKAVKATDFTSRRDARAHAAHTERSFSSRVCTRTRDFTHDVCLLCPLLERENVFSSTVDARLGS